MAVLIPLESIDGTTVDTAIEVVSLTGDMNAVLLDNPPEGLL